MKLLRKLLPIVAALACAGVAYGENVQQILTDAQVAYQRGDMPTAKRNFELVMRLDPTNKTAIGFLKMMKVQEAKDAGGSNVEKALAQLVIPQLQFKEATLGSALDFMKRKANELSGGKQSVNFVVQPGVDQNGVTVTLNLTGIPFTEALRYIGELANLSFVYQKYAIVVKPKGAVTASATPPQEPAPGQ